MSRGGKRPGAGGKKGSKHKPHVPKSTREQATAAFEGFFLKQMQPLLDATKVLVNKPDARMVSYVWDRLAGKAAQSFELPAGSNLSSVEVTYKIVSKPDA